jgi:hypothetical protein
MLSLPVAADTVEETAADAEPAESLHWHVNYHEAYAAAKQEGRLLLINFVPEEGDAHAPKQEDLGRFLEINETLRQRLGNLTLARLPADTRIEVDQKSVRLLDHPAFRDLSGPGIALLDFRDPLAPHFGRVVSALPFADGKYYRWRPSYLGISLDLPAGTITQRTMIWAVREHHESPESTAGELHPALVAAAEEQSTYQAQIGVQGHQRWNERFPRIRAAVHARGASEVVAESWPDESLIDACLDCVASWRQSPGHWEAVRLRQRLFGYDIRRGKNGIWYGTGIFAN